MDFSKFDNRTPAENGFAVDLLDPQTGEAVVDDNGAPCRVIVRGVASRTVQAEFRKRQKAKAKSRAANKSKADDEDIRVMEDVHKELCDSAAPLIVGFENVDHPDGRPCEAPKDVDWFLDLTFPLMGVATDDDGDPIIENGAPKYKMMNNPFAKQVSDAAARMGESSGNAQAS